MCELGFDGLDINMGCPAKKVAAAGCGAALIRTPELARTVVLAEPPVQRGAILANLNMDMLSRSDKGELWVAGTHHYPQLLPLVERVARRAPVKLRTGHDRPGVPGEDDWTTLSDHGPFHAAGIPFLYLGVEDHDDYHTPADLPEHVDPDFFAAATAAIADFLLVVDREEL